MLNKPKISVIIPLYNEEAYIGRCLDSLLGQNYPRELYEIIVVDNGSTDKSVEIAKRRDVTVISSDADYVGKVRNDGVAQASGAVLVFIDSDCLAHETWLKDGIELLQGSKLAAVGGRYSIRNDPSFYEKYWVLPEPHSSEISSDLIGGCIFVSRERFEKVGGFPEGLTAGEDSALSKLLVTEGGFTVTTALNVVHLGYPNDLSSFAKRQIWHSVSYAQNLDESAKEPMFLFIMLNVFALLVLTLGLLFGSYNVAFVAALVVAFLPLVLSLKRIAKSKAITFGRRHIIQIYIIDVIYLFARSYGVVKSLHAKLVGKGQMKSRK